MTGLINKLKNDLENAINKQDVRYFYFGMPKNLSKEQLMYGVIMINPVSQTVNAVTTGITEQEENSIEVILAKQVQSEVYRNAQSETGQSYLARVMCGTDDNLNLLSATVRQVVRNHMKNYGSMQPVIDITFDDNRIELEGVVTATMTVTQQNLTQQNLS